VVASRYSEDFRPPRNDNLGRLGCLALIGAGALVGSAFGALVALLALLAARRFGAGVVLRAAFLTLMLAACATIAIQPTSAYDVRFAIDRPLAAGLGLASAILALVGITIVVAGTRWVRSGATASSGNGSSPDPGLAHGQPRSWAYRIGSFSTSGIAPVLLLFSAVAVLAVLSNGAGHYVVDNHRELAWSPGQLLARQRFLWNADQGFGRPNEESWVVVGVFLGALRFLGASAALAGRLFHAALLVTGGVGMVALLRVFRGRIGIGHVVAGLLYMFNPYTAAALVPSILFVPYALAPWFLVVFIHGVKGQRPWRWSAVFALLALVASTADVPGLTFGLLPIVPAAIYLVYVERSVRWGRILGWLSRAFVLTAGVFAAPLFRSVVAGAALAQRVGTSELPAALNVASSWSESWRGLGFWLVYWRDSAGLVHPELGSYFSSPITILATFVAPCVAIGSLWWGRSRLRLLFAMTALVGLVFMVGTYPIGHPSPFGSALLHGYANSLFLWGWRNSYKAGPGWAIGVAGLVGLTAFEAARRLRHRVALRQTVALSAILVVGLASFPFWTNHLYGARDRLAAQLPSYWRSANTWLDDNARSGRVLVLPGMTIAAYHWGTPGGDAVDTKASILMARSFPFETPQTADLLHAVDDAIREGTLAGSIGPIASRLGVRYVLLQNDLDWQKTGAPRPAELRPVREDTALQRVATFGAPGTNVIDRSDNSLATIYESSLPPVEIYQIGQPPQPLVRPGPPLLVSGSGDAWSSLARDGRLGDDRPVVYTASAGAGDVKASLRTGSDVVITDTNRRRVTEATQYNEQTSYTLAPDANLDRPANPLFSRPDAESVARYGDATAITASGYGAALSGAQPWLRPANAFDGDPRTSWQTGGFGIGAGAWIRVDFPHSRRLSEVRLTDSPMPGFGRSVSKASISFSDGTRLPAKFNGGEADIKFPQRDTKSLAVRIDAIAGRGDNAVGFSEITIPGVSVGERIRVPEDVFVAADKDSALRGLLERAPLEYQFERSRATGGQDEEFVLHREFRSVGQRDYSISGTIQASDSTPDQVLAQLIGGPSPTFGSSRAGGLRATGNAAVDGDLNTSWGGLPQPGERLTTTFTAQPVSSVAVAINADPNHSLIREIRMIVGNESATATVPGPETCALGAPCIVRVAGRFSGLVADRATVEVTRVDPLQTFLGPAPVGIADLSVDGHSGTAVAPAQRISGCFGQLLQIDGRDQPLSLDGTIDDLLNGNAIPARGCAPTISLGTASHRLDSSTTMLMNDLELQTSQAAPASARPSGRVSSRSDTATQVRVNRGPGAIVLSGQAYDPGWRATIAGKDLGHPIAADTQSAWVLPAGGVRAVKMRYAAEGAYRVFAAISVACICLCLWLVVRRTRYNPFALYAAALRSSRSTQFHVRSSRNPGTATIHR
jgi:arabinofuranan 3-O-arabinosyltransferase